MKQPRKVSRTSVGLRDALFDELDRIRAGTTDSKKANAVARLACGIVGTVQLELDLYKHSQSGIVF